MTRKRSSKDRIKQNSQCHAGVGARHRQADRAGGGLGYLDIYTKTESSIQKNRASDPRILQLKKMGLNWRWIRIAERIGFDTFIQTWALISEMFDNSNSCIRPPIPHVQKLLRFQRNILIHRLHAQGCSVRHIHETVRHAYGVSMSHRSIRDVIYVG